MWMSLAAQHIGRTVSAGRGGCEVRVDRTEDPSLEGIVLVEGKKSRLGLDAVTWGPSEESMGNVLRSGATARALGPKASESVFKPRSFANVLEPSSKDKESSVRTNPVERLLEPRADESRKWWSIGRGRKDSEEQEGPRRSKCEHPFPFLRPG